MTIRGKRNYKRLGAVTIGFAGLLAASVAVANSPGNVTGPTDDGLAESHRDGDDDWNDDDWNDDDWDDDDKDHKRREPRFEDEGDSLRAELELRGLKKKRRVRAELEATAEVEIECRRKGKGKGKKKDFEKEIEIELEGVEFFAKDEIEDKRLDIEVETEDAEDALDDKFGHDGGCPGGYDRRIKEVSFLDARLDIELGKQDLVTWLCTFEDPTDDGRVPRRDVDCHRL